MIEKCGINGISDSYKSLKSAASQNGTCHQQVKRETAEGTMKDGK